MPVLIPAMLILAVIDGINSWWYLPSVVIGTVLFVLLLNAAERANGSRR